MGLSGEGTLVSTSLVGKESGKEKEKGGDPCSIRFDEANLGKEIEDILRV